MAKRKTHQQQPELVSRDGELCATFVNSASAKRPGFADYAELVAWSVTQGTLSDAQAQRLERLASERSQDAGEIVERAIGLRAGLERLFLAAAARQAPPAADLAALNAELALAMPARRLVAASSGCRWAWGDRGGDDLDRMLWPVLFSASEVLSSPKHRRVRQCAGEDCDLMFVDRTAGSPRKWCSMKACGNRVKALRHYRRVVRPQQIEFQKRREAKRWR